MEGLGDVEVDAPLVAAGLAFELDEPQAQGTVAHWSFAHDAKRAPAAAALGAGGVVDLVEAGCRNCRSGSGSGPAALFAPAQQGTHADSADGDDHGCSNEDPAHGAVR